MISEEERKLRRAAANRKYYETHKEQCSEIMRRWKGQKKQDEAYVQKINSNAKNKYDNDPEYRERKKAQMREYQKLRKKVVAEA